MIMRGEFNQIIGCRDRRRGVRSLSSGILGVFIMLWSEKKIRKVLSKFRPFSSHLKSKTTLEIDHFWAHKSSILRVVFNFGCLENGQNLFKTIQIFFSTQSTIKTPRIPEDRPLAPLLRAWHPIIWLNSPLMIIFQYPCSYCIGFFWSITSCLLLLAHSAWLSYLIWNTFTYF